MQKLIALQTIQQVVFVRDIPTTTVIVFIFSSIGVIEPGLFTVFLLFALSLTVIGVLGIGGIHSITKATHQQRSLRWTFFIFTAIERAYSHLGGEGYEI